MNYGYNCKDTSQLLLLVNQVPSYTEQFYQSDTADLDCITQQAGNFISKLFNKANQNSTMADLPDKIHRLWNKLKNT